MTNHVETLQKGREKMVKARRELAEGLSNDFDRGRTPQLRKDFLEIQSVIEQIDKAITDEHRLVVQSTAAKPPGDDRYTTEVPDDGRQGYR